MSSKTSQMLCRVLYEWQGELKIQPRRGNTAYQLHPPPPCKVDKDPL